MLIYLGILVAGFLGLQIYQYWSPDRVETSEHYRIESTETEEVTRKAAAMAESLFSCYEESLGKEVGFEAPDYLMEMRLYKTREEFKRCNVLVPGYAEAVYRGKCCHQYFNHAEANPWHWMLHEATHQLNREAADLSLKIWLEEGLACYFSTSRIGDDGKLQLGEIDYNTYPIWWLESVELSGDWETDVEALKIIPLQDLIKDKGPSRRKYFNTYYQHWWNLTHFLFHAEEGKYKDGLIELIKEGGSLSGFEKHIGKISAIEPLWYAYYQKWCGQRTPEKPMVFALADADDHPTVDWNATLTFNIRIR